MKFLKALWLTLGLKAVLSVGCSTPSARTQPVSLHSDYPFARIRPSGSPVDLANARIQGKSSKQTLRQLAVVLGRIENLDGETVSDVRFHTESEPTTVDVLAAHSWATFVKTGNNWTLKDLARLSH